MSSWSAMNSRLWFGISPISMFDIRKSARYSKSAKKSVRWASHILSGGQVNCLYQRFSSHNSRFSTTHQNNAITVVGWMFLMGSLRKMSAPRSGSNVCLWSSFKRWTAMLLRRKRRTIVSALIFASSMGRPSQRQANQEGECLTDQEPRRTIRRKTQQNVGPGC